MRSSRIGGILLRQAVRLQLVAPLSPRILETYRKLDAERLELAAARKEALRSKVRRLLLAAAAVVGTVVYVVMKKEEEEDFESQVSFVVGSWYMCVYDVR